MQASKFFQGANGDILTITGTKFIPQLLENIVTIGGVRCDVKTATASQLTCEVGKGPAGVHDVIVEVVDKGLADGGPFSFRYNFEVSGINPTIGSRGGKSQLHTVSENMRILHCLMYSLNLQKPNMTIAFY